MPIVLTQKLIDRLAEKGISTLLKPGPHLPDHVVLEPPLSLKWMSISHSLEMGAFSYAVSGFYFGCRIGRYCSFGEQVQIGRHPHPMHWVSTSPFFYQSYTSVLDKELPAGIELEPGKDFIRSGPPVVAKITTIGNDVWIGHGAFILPGVKIGDGACIAAMSVVTKDVPPYAIVAGSPARVRRYRFPDPQIEALLKARWWDWAPWDFKGLKVDDIPDFVGRVEELRARSAAVYAPEKLNPAELADNKYK